MGKVPFDFITTKTSHPLDRGWSWIIMMAAFGSQFIVIGYQRSFGLLFVAFQERYGYSSAVLSFVNGTQSLTYSFATLIVMNYLLKKISVRTSCLIGGCLETFGVIVVGIYPNMVSLIMCQGFLFGLGHSLLYCPTILILSQYFDVHRSVATAVALCGAAFGGIAFPYITRFLLNTYGLDGALLLLGGLIFHQSVFYALFQPIMLEAVDQSSSTHSLNQSTEQPSPPSHNVSQPNENINNNSSNNNNDNNTNKSNGRDKTASPLRIVVQNYSENLRKGSITDHEIDTTYDSDKDYPNIVYNGKSSLLTGTKADSSSQIARVGQLVLSSSQILKPVVGKVSLEEDIHLVGKDKLYSSHGIIPAVSTHLNQHLSRKSRELVSMLGGSTDGIHSSLPALMSPVHRQEAHISTLDMQLVASSDVTWERETPEDATAASLLGIKVKPESRKSCIPLLMRQSAFWLVAAYFIGGIVAAGCPAIYIPPLAKERSLTDAQATFFLTISAVSGIVGRIGSGLVLHFNLMNPCNLALLPLGLATVFFNLTPIFNDFGSILLLTLQYGFASSMVWTLSSLVIIDVLGLANLGPALGFYAVISGVTTSTSFPIAGWLRDETGSYSSSFHFFGAMSFVAALALIAIQIPRCRANCVARK